MRWLGASTGPAARFWGRPRPRGASRESSAPRTRLLRLEGRSLPSSRGSPGCVQYAPRRAQARCPRPPRGRGRGRLRVQAGADRRSGAHVPDHGARRRRSLDHARAPALRRSSCSIPPGRGSSGRSACRRRCSPPDAPVSQLRAQHPDLLIVPADTTTAEADSLARRVGAPTYVLAGFQLRAIEHGAAQLGLATGHARRGAEPRARAPGATPGARPPDRERERRRACSSTWATEYSIARRHAARDAHPRRRRHGSSEHPGAAARRRRSACDARTPTCTRSSARARMTLTVLRKRQGIEEPGRDPAAAGC